MECFIIVSSYGYRCHECKREVTKIILSTSAYDCRPNWTPRSPITIMYHLGVLTFA